MPPQTQRAPAPDFIPAGSTPDFIPAREGQPNSILGGAGRRLKSMFSDDGDKSLLENMLDAMPGLKEGVGLYQAERQLGPQFVQQAKEAAASHRGIDAMSPNLLDARAATTGLSMLDPFATGPVANINQLQSEGRGREAAGQGLTDAALLAVGGAAGRIVPKASARLNDYTPSGNIPKLLGREVTGRIPLVNRIEGFQKPSFTEYKNALAPDPQLSLYRNTPKLGNSPLAVTNPALPQGEIAPTRSFSPQPLARPELVPSPGRYTASPYAGEGIPTSAGVDPRTDIFANYGTPEAGPAPAPAPMDMSKYYGKTPTRSNLKANQRQLASPTASTAPVSAPYPPRIMNLLSSPVEPTDADILEIQQAVRNRRLVDQMP